MDLHLSGKVALVTGASRGIGRAIVETFSGEGALVVLVARSADALEALGEVLQSPNLRISMDLREPGEPERAVESAIRHFGRLDILVNNAGDTRRGDFLELTDEEWDLGFSLKF
ncbi:MAG: SDR family NAD(P)-dependent oxidoreductase, partial [Acidobacteria bacterium]|nr:SDR family NAD(P)-dependent oxidoreductase [Acidobacteriota bacterium]